MNRREFLYFSAGASALSAAGVTLPVLAGAPTIRIHHAVYDERFPEAMNFAREARELGIAASAIRGDVTDLWYGQLSLQWRARPLATAGVTNEDSLFCLEQFARDHRMRIVHREARGELISWVMAPVMGGAS